MCFHSKQSKDAQTVEHRFKAKIKDLPLFNSQKEFNGFTFPLTPIITNTAPDTIVHYNWGLIPAWSKTETIRESTLNARIETLHEKPSFRDVVNNRCLIISDGFYEWRWLDSKGKQKRKHLISLPNEALYAYAGIYSTWLNPLNGEPRHTYSIVTTEANELMASIHHNKRMPIILKPEDETVWLSGASADSFALPYQVPLVATDLDSLYAPMLF